MNQKKGHEDEVEQSAKEADATRVAEGEAHRKGAEAQGQGAMRMPDKSGQAGPTGPASPEQVKATNDFMGDFLRAPPELGEDGTYNSTVADRWFGNRYDVPDGDHHAGPWTLHFEGGHFVSATRPEARRK